MLGCAMRWLRREAQLATKVGILGWVARPLGAVLFVSVRTYIINSLPHFWLGLTELCYARARGKPRVNHNKSETR
jgi:hypothetical protein